MWNHMWNKLKRIWKEASAYLLTYVCTLVPILLLTLLTNAYLMSKMLRDVSTSQAKQLTDIAEQFDSMYAAYEVTATNLFFLSTLDKSAMLNESSARLGIDQLRVVAGSSFDINEISLFFFDRDVVYSSVGKSDLRVHMAGVLNLNKEAIDPAIELYASRTASVAYFPNASSGLLIFHYPARYGLNSGKASINFSMQMSTLAKQLTALTQNHSAEIQLIFADGCRLYLTGDGNGRISPSSASQYPDENAGQYIALSARSERCDLELRVCYKKHELFRDVEQISVLNAVMILVGLVLAMILCYYFSLRRYRNIQQISQLLARGAAVQNPSESYVREMIVQILEQNRELQSCAIIAQQRLLLQSSELLLSGYLKSETEIQQRFKSCGIELYDPYFVVLAITGLPNDSVLDQLSAALAGDIYCKTTFGYRNGVLALMQMNTADYDRKLRRTVLTQLIKLIKSMGGRDVRIACSSVFTDLTTAGSAAIEARYAMESESDGSAICYYENVMQQTQANPLSDAFRGLRTALRNKNEEQANHYLHQICSAEAERDRPPFERQFQRLRILHALMQEIDRTGNTAAALIASSVEATTPLPEFSDRAHQIIQTLCVRTAHTDSFVQVLNYIEKRCGDSTLSLGEIADYFHLNRSYLSTLFRERTNSTYGDYLTRLRMNRAYSLIAETSLSITEIIAQVGYVDDGHFRKRFREIFNMTPSDLRRSTKQPTHSTESTANDED